MRILIDGYNLLFQSQLVGRGRGPGWLQRARDRLIKHLHSHIAKDLLARTTIVFDASQTGDASKDVLSSHGVSILFAREHPEADDLLEELIRQHSSPKNLTVVSSDQRIRRCANGRRARSIDSEAFLDSLEKQEFQLPKSATRQDNLSDEPLELSEEQIEYWLREFGS